MKENQITLISRLLKVDIVYEKSDGTLLAYFDVIALSPLMQSDQLRRILREGAQAQSAPFLYADALECYFAGIRAEDGVLYLGPMCHQKLASSKLARMYRTYGISGTDAQTLPVFTLPQIRDMVALTNSILDNASPEDEELLRINNILVQDEQDRRRDQTGFILREEEENDSDSYRHSYQEERLLMQAIRDGRPGEAVRLAENMDRDSGQMSKDYLRHRRNLAMIGIALCSRAAIEGGMSPESAYRISGYYIEKCDATDNPTAMLRYRNQAIEELAGGIDQMRSKASSSNYTERCKDYIRKHYREKIYLEDIAEQLALSPTYLSRLFKKETGESITDYLNKERINRACNLLLYSDLPLPEIAQYVGYPTQSYFGKTFLRYRNMTPKAYQDRYRSKDFHV